MSLAENCEALLALEERPSLLVSVWDCGEVQWLEPMGGAQGLPEPLAWPYRLRCDRLLVPWPPRTAALCTKSAESLAFLARGMR